MRQDEERVVVIEVVVVVVVGGGGGGGGYGLRVTPFRGALRSTPRVGGDALKLQRHPSYPFLPL